MGYNQHKRGRCVKEEACRIRCSERIQQKGRKRIQGRWVGREMGRQGDRADEEAGRWADGRVGGRGDRAYGESGGDMEVLGRYRDERHGEMGVIKRLERWQIEKRGKGERGWEEKE